MLERLMNLNDAVKLVNDGDLVYFGGILANRVPMATIHELVRSGKKDLHILCGPGGFPIDFLAGLSGPEQIVKAVDFYFVGFQYKYGFAQGYNFRRAVEKGQVDAFENAGYVIMQGLRAEAMGVPYLPIKSFSGSDLITVLSRDKMGVGKIKQIECPFTGEKLLAVRAIRPNVAFFHAQKGDKFGNVVVEDPGPGTDKCIASASDKVVVTVEEVVSHEEIRSKVSIPYFYVDSICYAPFGAYPMACYNHYKIDHEHIREYISAAQNPEKMNEYYQKYVFGVKSHEEFLEKIGRKKIQSLMVGSTTLP